MLNLVDVFVKVPICDGAHAIKIVVFISELSLSISILYLSLTALGPTLSNGNGLGFRDVIDY